MNSHHTSSENVIPLIDIPPVGTSKVIPAEETSRALVTALQNSGFLLIKSPLLTPEFQSKSLESSKIFLNSRNSHRIVDHPSDPKVYAMLNSIEECQEVSLDLQQYMDIMQKIKVDVLMHLAVGLEMKDTDFFTKLHSENNDALRLINYHPADSSCTGNRCKEHSDYGTITLLSTDGVSGLECFHSGGWIPVPYIEGTLVVNIGTLLSGWTNGLLKATLHRVAGPKSSNSQSLKEDLIKACKQTRSSIAFFADPNQNISSEISNKLDLTEGLKDALQGMTVAEYVEWRSGGSPTDHNRSGVGLTSNESDILRRSNED